MTVERADGDWWRDAVMYQLYPRSFKDHNGDGIGDLQGIIDGLPYLQEMGVDGIWINPICKAGSADGGYDVIDYKKIDEQFGSLADFELLIRSIHAAGMHVITDIVPNHTSTDHEWFKQALASGPGSAERDMYIFRDGRGKCGELPPTNWISKMGGPAWQRVPDGQWYLHIYSKNQADLNWNNNKVREEFEGILRFWGDLGIDGFRVDVANGLVKQIDGRDDLDDWTVEDDYCVDGRHPLWDRDEVHEIYRSWRKVLNEYDPPLMAVAEVSIVPEHESRYASADELGQVFNFDLLKSIWTFDSIEAAIQAELSSMNCSHSSATWVLSNHDTPRVVSRYGLPQISQKQPFRLAQDWLLRDGTSYEEDRSVGLQRARSAALLEFMLPGSVYIYQGDELGLPEVATIPWDRLEDPTAVDSVHQNSLKGRDGCRIPLPWKSADKPHSASWSSEFGEGASFGFSPSAKRDGSPSSEPHLPQPMYFGEYAVDEQQAKPESMLCLYTKAIRLRHELFAGSVYISSQEVTWMSCNGPSQCPDGANGQAGGILAFQRESVDGRHIACIVNFSAEPFTLPAGEVLLSSGRQADGKLPQDTCVWLALSEGGQ
ncbi:glycoside hydrolase family 13 protein [Bifidobacterium sp. H1HS10N]|uniref:glycoside hydrolase family 13 protein n=1 Tax=Bifidobacterium kimbladii TaxID=1293826 RepID=UPI0028BD53C3|nr:glycoside hydrolase family 13 protein [Bifidobacterium sp. H1HS10N]MDT7513455.1 glycoside hydrolase family 13 protein [Bifidobacterium sp. H1HS10N]